jgi:hypothetical protein
MVLVAHASGALEKLDEKWFQESPEMPTNESRAKEPKRTKAGNKKIDKGDLVKAREIIERERANIPDLVVTIALTTNREPSIVLRSKVEQFAVMHNVAIDVWTGSRIASVLDQSPNGQWMRKTLLGIEADRVSRPLLNALGKRSLQDSPAYRSLSFAISREFDQTLQDAIGSQLLFVIGDSGSGKSVACQKLLAGHLDVSGLAFVLNDQLLRRSIAIEEAIDSELRRLHPTIEKGAGRRALELATESDPVLLLIEDVNRSAEPGKLIDRVVGWATKQDAAGDHNPRSWRIICPLWSQSIPKSSDSSQKYIGTNAIYSTTFSRNEAVEVLVSNARTRMHSVSEIEASSVADALGDDPLLIDLFEWEADANPHRVVADYVTRALERLSATSNLATVDEYRASLTEIGRYLMSNRLRRVRWLDFRDFMQQHPEVISRTRELFNDRQIIRLSSSSAGVEEIVFRHDQVEFHVLGHCVVELHQQNALGSQLLADPYYAHVFGQALLFEPFNPSLASRVYELNPLALFHAVRKRTSAHSKPHQSAVELCKKWLSQPASRSRRYRRLRYAILSQLRQLHDPIAIELLDLIPDASWVKDEIRLLNGDARAGIRICANAGAGVGHPRRDSLIAHAQQYYGAELNSEIDHALRDSTVSAEYRSGAIRLAGFISSTNLLDALTTAWEAEAERQELLPDYLFAAAHCSGKKSSLLTSLCDFWELLPDARRSNMYSERDEILVHDFKFACRRGLPETTIRFFVSRAQTSSLQEQIETALGVVDHPLAVESTIRWRASRRRAANDKGESWYWRSLAEEWLGGFDGKRKMSQSSKQTLEDLWLSKQHDPFLRREAFGLWSAAATSSDLEKLRAAAVDAVISDDVLRTRLKLRDVSAIDEFVDRQKSPKNWHWWQHVRGFRHPKLVAEIDRQLERRRPAAGQKAETSDAHWMLGEMMIRADSADATTLLVKHWDHVGTKPYFVQAALYCATPETLSVAAKSINSSPDAKELFAHIHMHFGVKTTGHAGVYDVSQLEALVPYLHLLDENCVYIFWDLCNEKRWYEFRKKHLDPRLSGQWRKVAEIESSYIDESLDALVENKRYDDAYLWAERQIEKYDLTRNLLLKVVDWSKRRGTLDSLAVATRVFEETATRADLDLIDQLRFEPVSETSEIIDDAKFSVMMRSLV